MSQYKTIQEQGLYYIQDLHFLPATADNQQITQCQVIQTDMPTVDITTHDATTIKTGTARVMDHVDFDNQLHVENRVYQVRPLQETINPIQTQTTPRPTEESQHGTIAKMQACDNIARDVLNFETWHQRLAHCSEKRLRRTQQLVDGIPQFHISKLPHVVNCRTCDIAKLKKAPRGKPGDHTSDLQPGQVFSMDIGFIRGPKNVAAVVARTEEAALKVIESRQGYVCYLLIIDNKSRYTWPFPLKSKSIPLDLIKTFLQTHGNHNCINRRIRTDGEGSLAESAACRTLLNQLG